MLEKKRVRFRNCRVTVLTMPMEVKCRQWCYIISLVTGILEQFIKSRQNQYAWVSSDPILGSFRKEQHQNSGWVLPGSKNGIYTCNTVYMHKRNTLYIYWGELNIDESAVFPSIWSTCSDHSHDIAILQNQYSRSEQRRQKANVKIFLSWEKVYRFIFRPGKSAILVQNRAPLSEGKYDSGLQCRKGITWRSPARKCTVVDC